MHCPRGAQNIMGSHIDRGLGRMPGGAIHENKSAVVTRCQLSLQLPLGLG